MPMHRIVLSGSLQNRLILLGASNLTLSLRLVIHLLQQRLGLPSEIFVAAGHGRAYGVASRMLLRGLPSIIECGLWSCLTEAKPHRTYALLTDIGNDILYGAQPENILYAVEKCIMRLQQQSALIVVTNLPLTSIVQLTEKRYQFFRHLLYPFCRLSRSEVIHRASIVHAGLNAMSTHFHFKLYEQQSAWLGRDGVHVKLRHRQHFYADIAKQFPINDFPPVNKAESILPWSQYPKFAFKTVLGHPFNYSQPSGCMKNGSVVSKY